MTSVLKTTTDTPLPKVAVWGGEEVGGRADADSGCGRETPGAAMLTFRPGLVLLLLGACRADNHTAPDPMSLPCGKHFRS